jgi:hypothetical protein
MAVTMACRPWRTTGARRVRRPPDVKVCEERSRFGYMYALRKAAMGRTMLRTVMADVMGRERWFVW